MSSVARGWWKETGKFYSLSKDIDGQVTSLTKSDGDISKGRRPYSCKSWPDFHKTIVSIEKKLIDGFHLSGRILEDLYAKDSVVAGIAE